jgi:3-hydroxyacyl-[acyl-carrier-protein] dehydratase
MKPTTHSEKFHIAASHPALPGHFPGDPVVPGVVLLDRVMAAIERAWAGQVAGFPQVKFLRPLRPGQAVELIIERDFIEHDVIEPDTASARFRILDGAQPLTSGTIEIRA